MKRCRPSAYSFPSLPKLVGTHRFFEASLTQDFTLVSFPGIHTVFPSSMILGNTCILIFKPKSSCFFNPKLLKRTETG